MTVADYEHTLDIIGRVFGNRRTQWRTSLGPFYPNGGGDFAPMEFLIIEGEVGDDDDWDRLVEVHGFARSHDCSIVVAHLAEWELPG